jgi:Spy/CpxP family protein refolding chaperone
VNTWKVILATLVIFGTGVITGGLLVVYSNSAAHQPEKAAEVEGPRRNPPPFPGPGAARDPRIPVAQHFLLRKEFLTRLNDELKLTPEQRERIEKIMGEGQQRIQEFSQQIDPQIRAELSATRERIRAELTPGQQTLYADLLKRRPNMPPRGPTNTINATPVKPQR